MYKLEERNRGLFGIGEISNNTYVNKIYTFSYILIHISKCIFTDIYGNEAELIKDGKYLLKGLNKSNQERYFRLCLPHELKFATLDLIFVPVRDVEIGTRTIFTPIETVTGDYTQYLVYREDEPTITYTINLRRVSCYPS